jgi:hypothetical protein
MNKENCNGEQADILKSMSKERPWDLRRILQIISSIKYLNANQNKILKSQRDNKKLAAETADHKSVNMHKKAQDNFLQLKEGNIYRIKKPEVL